MFAILHRMIPDHLPGAALPSLGERGGHTCRWRMTMTADGQADGLPEPSSWVRLEWLSLTFSLKKAIFLLTIMNFEVPPAGCAIHPAPSGHRFIKLNLILTDTTSWPSVYQAYIQPAQYHRPSRKPTSSTILQSNSSLLIWIARLTIPSPKSRHYPL